jgi:hypothetical protein
MTVLVLVFCLQAAPTSCAEQHPMAGLSLQACLVRGQEYASEWLAQHPKWTLLRWRCEQNLPRQKPV